MLKPQVFSDANKKYHILCLGAHCDDIEIGCGAALLKLIESNSNVHITWVVFTSNESRRKEAEAGAKLFTEGCSSLDLRIYDLRDGFLPYFGVEVKELFEKIKSDIEVPDVIFTHYRNDLHQDHKKVSELTWNTFRNHFILEYEIPKWDGDIGTPNTFVEVSKELANKKIQLLQTVYNTQKNKKWFTDDLFSSLMRIRGMECNAASQQAEAFYTRKISLDLTRAHSTN